MRRILIAFGLFISLVAAKGQTFVAPNDPNINMVGAYNVFGDADSVLLNRHQEGVLAANAAYINDTKAKQQSCVVLRFRTASPNIELEFHLRQDIDLTKNLTADFGIYEDSVYTGNVKDTIVTISSASGTSSSLYEVVLPSFTGVIFKGMTLDNGYTLETVESNNRPNYVAIGNSITHGRGQGSASYLTYPWLLARKNNWNVTNLAVGGSKIAPTIGDELEGKQIDVISILWGYNDWNTDMTYEDIASNLRSCISGIRQYQPCARIYYITPTFTTSTTSKNSSKVLDVLRDTLANVITKFINQGDDELYLLRGESFSDVNFLKDGGIQDPVHFSEEGAQRMADSLASRITLRDCPYVTLGEDDFLCDPSLVLDAEQCNDGEYSNITYLWSTGEDTPTIEITEPGTYSVEVSADNCPTVSDEIIFTDKGFDFIYDTVQNNENFMFTSSQNVIWSTVDNDYIEQSTSLTVSNSGSDTVFYFYEEDQVGLNVGKSAPSSEVWNSTKFDENKLIFDVYQTLIIDSVEVHTLDVSGSITVRILNAAQTEVLAESSVDVTQSGMYVVPLHAILLPGENYVIDGEGTTVRLKQENGNDLSTSFPYEISNVISINETTPTWNLTNNRFTYFYNWHLRTIKEYNCDQSKAFGINEVVSGLGSVEIGSKEQIYPNPSATGFYSNLVGGEYSIFDLQGKVVEQGEIKSSVVAGASLSQGLYLVLINKNGKVEQYNYVAK